MNHTPRWTLGRILLQWAAGAAGIVLAAALLRYLKIEVETGGGTGLRGGEAVPADADMPENTPEVGGPYGAEPDLLWNTEVLE